MWVNKILKLVLVLFVIVPFSVEGQNLTNSPYTRFGWGELSDNVIGRSQHMGGVAIGLRSLTQINPTNPASYSDVESQNFLFDFGVIGQFSNIKSGNNSEHYKNASINYIAMAFPLSSKIGMSVGLRPFSSIGYSFNMLEIIKQPNGISTGTIAQETFKGEGGLSQLYVGAAVELMHNLSFGFNVAYLFGSQKNDRMVSFPYETSINYFTQEWDVHVNDVRFDLGLQYTMRLSGKDNLTMGAVYAPKKKLNTKSSANMYSGTTSQDSVLLVDRNDKFELPNSYGFGLSYNRNNKLTVGADFEFQNWKNATYFSKKDTLSNRYKISLGAEYIPSLMTRRFLKSIRYRAGLAYEHSYVNVNGHSIDAYHATVGLGIPIRNSASMLNLGFQYIGIPSSKINRIEENNYRITLGIIFNERWFRKTVFN